MTLFLCGFMGCGKTALGRVLAEQLQMPLVDMDAEIVRQTGMTIPEIFEQNGEEAFRRLESNMIRTLSQRTGIVSCGGGAMVNPVNAVIVQQYKGIIIYLQQSFEVCYERIRNDKNRPLVQRHTKEELQQLFEERERWYQINATYSVLAGNTPEESAERVIKILKKWSPAFLPKEEV